MEYGYDAQGNLTSALQGGPGVGTVLTSLSHDLRGRKTAMTAPDHGAWSYIHNAFGELVRQTDAKQQITTATFDRAGRLIRRDHYGPGEIPVSVQPIDRAEWLWIQGKMVLEDTHRRLTTSQMEPLPRLSRNFVYDLLGRVEEVHTTIQGTNYTERTTYDQYGRVFQSFDASGVDRGAEHIYNAHGYLSQVIEAQLSAMTTNVHYEVLAMNARGQVTSQRKGGTTETRQYDPVTGMPSQFQVRNAAQQTLDTQTFQFDVLGNLTHRTQGSHSETLSYDNLNRLTGVNTSGSAPNLSVAYNALGNITSKSNVGSYSYGAGSAGPHAVTSAGGVSYGYDANGNMVSGNGRTITWMPFNKPSQIQQSNRSVTFEYGPQRERYQRTDSTSSGTTITRYVGSVEIITRPGGTELKRYLPGGVVVTVTGTTSERLALFHDHLGSVTLIVDDAGQVAQRLAFDAFGKRRSTTDWTTLSDSQIWGFNSLRTTRGFTFHEQLDPVGLVHMNGRVYDPHLGRFLSPDPFVQAPGDTQNLNRYSYVINNPLSYTDPSGYILKKLGNAIGKAVKRAVKGVLEFGVGVAVSFGEAAALTTPMGAFIFFVSAAYHVSRATQRSGGHSPPGAFGNGGNVWRGGGRTVFVPALNGGHGHGFMSAGLTGFALQGHEAGVDAGKEYIIHAAPIVHEARGAYRGGVSSHVMESTVNRPRTARQQISVVPMDFPIFSETGEQETQYRETYVWEPVDRRGGLVANVGQGFVGGFVTGGFLLAARGALEGLIESLVVYTQHGERMAVQEFLYRRDWKVFVITYDENDLETGRRVLRNDSSEPVWKPASSGGRHSYPAARQCWIVVSDCE